MRQWLRPHLTYSNVMATLAVFLVLGGGAYAALRLPKNSVRSRNIKNGQVKTADLANGAVKKPKLGANSVNAAKVLDGSLGGADIQDGSLLARNFKAGELPVATTFNTTRGQGTVNSTLVELDNGITLAGGCDNASGADLTVRTTSGEATLETSGTLFVAGASAPFDDHSNSSDRVSVASNSGGGNFVTIDAIARDTSVGKFARIDFHGTPGAPCHFSGTVIPSD